MRYILLLSFLLFINHSYSQNILIETEGFSTKGGWVIDPQFIDVMGSPYLLAHGKGIPVDDARTAFYISNKGNYHVWLRTFNWNSPWNDAFSPGMFQLIINGTTIGDSLGLAPKNWGWIKAGSINLIEGKQNLVLHDLTGFDGRCDAVFLTQDQSLVPPDSGIKLSEFRNQFLDLSKKQINQKFDLVVVGAGVAGMCAAISASRMGLKTALIHNRSVVGGNNSPEIKVTILGGFKLPPYENLGNIIAELGNAYENHNRVLSILKKEENLTLILNNHAFDVEMVGNKITAVLSRNIESNVLSKLQCSFVADCSGDGSIGFAAGADFRTGRETRLEFGETLAPEVADDLSYGSTLKWNSTENEKGTSFPILPWAVQFSEATVQYTTQSSWNYETGFHYDQIQDLEFIRDYALRVTYGNWSYLKNFSSRKGEFKNRELDFVAYVPGKRESRRLMGDVVFTQQDVEGGWKKYDDACIKGTYSLDQHFPDPENTVFFPGEEFRSIQKHNFNPIGVSRKDIPDNQVNSPYMLPYRCLYSRNISNLFMAGRDISTTRIAMTSSRIQATTGMMGEVVGIAASLCIKNNCLPRELYQNHLNQLLTALKTGVVQKKPEVFKPRLH